MTTASTHATQMPHTTTTHPSNGARLVTADGRALPLRSAAIRGLAGGGLACVTLEQVFANPFAEPLRLTYQMPLPADGAVSAYSIHIGERTLRGEIDTRKAARERFDRAMIEGRTAGLLEQERSSVFTQEIGNVPAGTEVRAEISVDQRLTWLVEGRWEWRFPTVVAPRFLGDPGRVDDASRVTVEVADRELLVRASLDLAIDDRLADQGRPESPSHSVLIGGIDGLGASSCVVTLAEGAALDRDIVVRWPVAIPETGVTLRRARKDDGAGQGAAYGLLTMVPPVAPARTMHRDLTLLLDTSGSMSGLPLDHAKRIATGLIDTLTDDDTLEVIAFSSRPRPWSRSSVRASAAKRGEAIGWVRGLVASGGTEMVEAVQESLRPLRDGAQKQVVLITDGLVGFESRVLRSIRDGLPRGCRLHVVGVGSAVNRSLSAAAARAGRGRELLAGLDAETAQCAERLVAATRAPVVTDIVIEGSAVMGCAPRACPDLFAGSPVLAGVKLRPEGGDLVVRGRTAEGPWERRLAVEPTGAGEGHASIPALFAREAVEDLELDLATGERRGEIDKEIERIGLAFAIATRVTSWVAISDRQDVDPREPARVERIPQGLPYGMSAIGLGLAPAAGAGAGLVMRSLMTLDMSASMKYAPQTGAAGSGGTDEYDVDAAGGVEGRDADALRESGESAAGLFRGRRRGRPPHRHPFHHLLESLGYSRPEDFPEPRRGEIMARWIGRGMDGVWFLEFVITGGSLDWDPRPPVLVTLESGEIREHDIDRDASTGPGGIGSGLLIRLVVRISDDEQGRVRAMFVRTGSETLQLILGS